jgi:hypothetical protein
MLVFLRNSYLKNCLVEAKVKAFIISFADARSVD